MDPRTPEFRPSGALDILSSVGVAVYEWTARGDRLVWGANAPELLGTGDFEAIGTGARYEALVDPATPDSRAAVIASTPNTDIGEGVPFRAVYRLRRPGSDEPGRWVEDVGRWFADGRGRPDRARGVVRILEGEPRAAVDTGRFDALTGQLERGHFLGELERILTAHARSRRPAAFLLASVEGLGGVNRNFGISVGDAVIAEAARRIRSELRAGDLVGRYSGNRLGIVIMDCSEAAMAVAGERFAAAARARPVETPTGPIGLAVTVGGVALGRRAETLAGVMLLAERALRLARAERPGGFVPAPPDRVLGPEAAVGRIARLAAAIGNGSLHLVYAPRHDCQAGRATAWRIEPRMSGWTSDDILATAEKAGLGAPLGFLLLERLGADLSIDPGLRLTIAVPSAAPIDPRWIGAIDRLLRRGCEPEAFGIAIPAACLVAATPALERSLTALGGSGIHLTVTGFGAGAVDFDRLARLKPAEIELDARFGACRSEEAGLVAGLVQVAAALGAEVAAAGVSDHGAAARLHLAGVRRIGGPAAGPVRDERPGRDDLLAVPA